MKNRIISKQVVGIDIGKDEFYACYKVLYTNSDSLIKGTKSFLNTSSGILSFYKWSKKLTKSTEIKVLFIMEATGVYYEDIAYFLYEKGEKVSVQLAQKVKYFAKSCNLKTKTDKVDAKMIAEFGIEKHLKAIDIWSPPSENFKMIRDLSREHTSISAAKTAAMSQLHALKYAHKVNKIVISMKEEQIYFYKKQLKLIEQEMRALVKADDDLALKVKRIETIKGIGFLTVIKLVSELNGFQLFKNIRQLVSYAGLDVVENSSGKHQGKTRISKKGNTRVRTALYMPSLSAVRYNKRLKTFYDRIMKNRKAKKQGLVAVMRKLLIYVYTLWNNETEFIEDFQMVKK